jgi:hypothetical protein
MAYPREKILPLPTLDLKINLGGALQVYENGHTDTYTESWCVGLWRVPHTLDWPPDLRLFGVHFKPEGAYPFLQLPLSELHNRVVTLDAIWGQYAAELRERLYAAPIIRAGFALLEQFLLERLGETPVLFRNRAERAITRGLGFSTYRRLADAFSRCAHLNSV